MASYVYRCGTCGDWEVSRSIGTADPTSTCLSCGAAGRRIYTPPLPSRTPRRLAAARVREEASCDVPEVTTGIPPKPRRGVPKNPRWSRLPRP